MVKYQINRKSRSHITETNELQIYATGIYRRYFLL